MQVAAIIQARMGSTRLPGKCLLPLEGSSVLAHVVTRARLARRIHTVVVATTDRPEDDAIASECARLGVEVVRGADRDVLDRYRLACESSAADIVVRITADCPLLDPEVTDRVVSALASPPEADYASNALPRSFPRGLDVEAMPAAILAAAAREARDAADREHVTSFIYNRPERFRLRNVLCETDWSGLRWTLDTAVDYEYLQRIFERARISTSHVPPFDRVAALVARDSTLMMLNSRAVELTPSH